MLALEVYRPGSANQRSERAEAVFNFQNAAGLATVAFDLVNGTVTVVDPRALAGPLLLNGRAQPKVRQLAIEPNDQLRWAGYAFLVVEVLEPSAAEQELLRHAQSNRQARDVYADWLEARGAVQCAEYTRLAAAERTAAQTQRLGELASRISAAFRAMVTRAQVLQCRQQGCPQRWEALEFTTGTRRTCTHCHLEVELCEDLRRARELATSGPLAIEPWVPGGAHPNLERATPAPVPRKGS